MFADNRAQRWLSEAALIVLAGWTGLSRAEDKNPPKPKDIVEVAKSTENLKTFWQLVDSAELTETLKAEGPYTVFAPTDDAFKKLGKELDELKKAENKARLQRVLKNHVVEGRVTAAELMSMKTVKTLAGQELKVTSEGGVVKVGTAEVKNAEKGASNGVIHIVEVVLVPAPEGGAHP